MPIGLILRHLGVLDHNIEEKFSQYLTSGSYLGELIAWREYLPSGVTSAIISTFGESGFKVVEEYLSHVVAFFFSSVQLYLVVSLLYYLIVFVFFRSRLIPRQTAPKY